MVRPPSKPKDGLFGVLAHEVPEGDVDGGDGGERDALAAEGERAAIHLLPEVLDVPGIGAEKQRLEVDVDELLGHHRRQRGVAQADEAVVGEDLDDEPVVKGEVAHRGLAEGDEVHGVGAEVWRQGNGLAFPLDDASTDFGDFHAALSISCRSVALSG